MLGPELYSEVLMDPSIKRRLEVRVVVLNWAHVVYAIGAAVSAILLAL